jgi:hypothetical protein
MIQHRPVTQLQPQSHVHPHQLNWPNIQASGY